MSPSDALLFVETRELIHGAGRTNLSSNESRPLSKAAFLIIVDCIALLTSVHTI